jgi:hypothetical protein
VILGRYKVLRGVCLLGQVYSAGCCWRMCSDSWIAVFVTCYWGLVRDLVAAQASPITYAALPRQTALKHHGGWFVWAPKHQYVMLSLEAQQPLIIWSS